MESFGGEPSPQPERIKYTPDALKPPEKNLRLSYVIPIRGEVNNGNFFLQLRDF